MKLHISPLIIPLAAAAAATGSAQVLLTAYISVALHELAHLAAAACMGLRAESVSFSPFGAHLTLKNKIVRSVSDEIILYGVGPLANGAMALLGTYFGNDMLYKINIGLMLINIMPVLPLDGGVIAKRILSYHIGQRAARRILTVFSVITGISFLTAAVISFYKGHINPSMFIMAVFLMGNAVTGRELYDIDFISGLSAPKRTDRARLVVIDDHHTMLDAARQISPRYTVIAAQKDDSGNITLISEQDIIKKFLKF